MRLACAFSSLAVLLCLSSSASATAPLVEGPTEATLIAKLDRMPRVATDYRRYALIPEGAGRYRLVDDSTGQSSQVELPCLPSEGSRGVFLLVCLDENGPTGYRLFSARSLRVVPVPGVRPYDRLGGIGRYWTIGDTSHPGADPNSADYGGTIYINWRTGERIEEAQLNGRFNPWRDLDSPTLSPTTPQPTENQVVFSSPPIGLLWSFAARTHIDLYSNGERITRLSSCVLSCEAALAGGDRVLWLERAGYGRDCQPSESTAGRHCFDVRGYMVDGARRPRWRLSHVTPRCDLGCQVGIAMTRRRVYIQVATGIRYEYNSAAGKSDEVPASSRLYAARWPAR
jgi:hypothetical protein